MKKLVASPKKKGEKERKREGVLLIRRIKGGYPVNGYREAP
jgi:hypothetical protein